MTDALYLANLQRYWKRHRNFPSLTKLCEVVGPSSTSSVFSLISRLCETGHLQRNEGRVAPGPRFFARPLLGTVRAGLPQPVSQEEPEVLTLDDYLIDEPDSTAIHRVRGDSMTGVGIYEGDLVMVEQRKSAKPGSIVLAAVDGELTVKTLVLDDDGNVCLQPENPAYDLIRPRQSLEVLGVVVSVARRLPAA